MPKMSSIIYILKIPLFIFKAIEKPLFKLKNVPQKKKKKGFKEKNMSI